MRFFRNLFTRELPSEGQFSNDVKVTMLKDYLANLQSGFVEGDKFYELIINKALVMQDLIKSIESANKASAKLVECLSTSSDPYGSEANKLKSEFFDEAKSLMMRRSELNGFKEKIDSELRDAESKVDRPNTLIGRILQNIANFFNVLFGTETDQSDLKNKRNFVDELKEIEDKIKIKDLEIEVKDIFNTVQAQFTFNDRSEIYSSLQTNISPQIAAYNKSYQDPDMQQMLAANIFDKATGYLAEDFPKVLDEISKHENVDYRNHEVERLNGNVIRLEQELLSFKDKISNDGIVPLDDYSQPYDFSEYESGITNAKALLEGKASEFSLVLNQEASPNLMDKFSKLLIDDSGQLVSENSKQKIFDEFTKLGRPPEPENHHFEEAVTMSKEYEETKEVHTP